jgi:hypothetical protein
MLKQIILARNALDPETWESHYATDIREFLVGEFDVFPDTARIYQGSVSAENDVTPSDEAGIERLGELEGPFYVIVYPGEPITIIVAVVAVVAVAAVFMLTPAVPTLRNTQTESPNNELSQRENKPRLLARIPDIFGTVTSTPDLIAVPYKEFIDHQEVEYSYMSIGRGEYDIQADNVYDGDTKISEIAGAAIEVFAPGTSPNSGTPQLSIGSVINEPVWKVVRSNAINGQELIAPDAANFSGVLNTRFVYPNEIQVSTAGAALNDKFTAGSSIVVSNASYTGPISSGITDTVSAKCTLAGEIVYASGSPSFSAGDIIVVENATYYDSSSGTFVNLSGTYTVSSVGSTTITLSSPSSVNSYWSLIDNFTNDETGNATITITSQGESQTVDLSGTYTISSVTSQSIFLSSPSSVNADWADIDNYTTNATGYISPYMYSSGIVWIGPFTLDVADLDQVYINLVALNGLYKDDGKQQYAFNIAVQVGVTPVDASGNATGSEELFTGTVLGSSTTTSTRALTIKINPTFTGRCKVRVRRTTSSDLSFEGSVVDTVKWRDLYAMSPVSQTDFGNVTTVQSVTFATDGALAVKSRRLNMIATRKIPINPTRKFTMNIADEGWFNFGGATVTQQSATTISAYAGGATNFGVRRPFEQLISGGKIQVTFTLASTDTTGIQVGFFEPGAWRSNVVTVTPNGTQQTITLTANANTTAAALLFFRFNPGTGSFTVSDVSVVCDYFTTVKYPTNRAEDIFVNICTDQYIGNRSLSEIDTTGIYSTCQDIRDYFETDQAAEFNYTFDADNLSFEESAQSIGQAIFSLAYRQGSLIKLKFEKETNDSTLLFNHRNKLPDTEKRTVRFGNEKGYDGVEFVYASPDDDAMITYYIPSDQSAINPKRIESVGIRNHLQAYFQAWRSWNKIRYQNTFTEFEATQEADLLVISDRILVADNTRSGTQDGEVTAQNVLELTLSQNVTFATGVTYTIFLQHTDGTVESIGVTAGTAANKVVLAQAPKQALSTSQENYARTGYIIVGDNEPRGAAFLVGEKEPQTNFTSVIRAVNYDSRYYSNDADFADGIIDANGDPV